MFYKDNLTLLAEAAEADLKANTLGAVTESRIMRKYEEIGELNEEVVYPAEMVPVIKAGRGYYTEMQFIAPYMSTNGIRKVSEALDNIASANGLPSRGVGLLIESEDKIKDMIDDAKSKSAKAGDKAMEKVKKGEKLVDDLKDKGYDVKKKIDKESKKAKKKVDKATKNIKDKFSKKEVCPECGKEECVCDN